MKFNELDAWMRERAEEPQLSLCEHEARSVTEMPIGLALRMTLEEAREYATLSGRVKIWARGWGRTCDYDSSRRVFVFDLRKKGVK